MTKIIGVVASIHRNGLSERLVKSVLDGVRSAGCETRLIHLSDYDVPQWSEDNVGKPKKLSEAFKGMNGLVICAPVYYLDINGLAKDFMDTVELPDVSGMPGMGITIAGGTGKGMTSALKTIYYWFFCKSMRGIDPIPVSRFNYEASIKQAYASGKKLAELASSGPKPFRSLAEQIAYHQALPFMGYEYVDEISLLVQQLLSAPHGKDARTESRAKKLFEDGMRLIEMGKKQDAVWPIVEAYEMLYY
ncbi:MAG: flavodoxin family protein [Thermoproteota archaeon]